MRLVGPERCIAFSEILSLKAKLLALELVGASSDSRTYNPDYVIALERVSSPMLAQP